MRVRGQTKVRFTPAMWEKWRARMDVDEQTIHLRAGIQDFRARLAAKRRRAR